MKNRTYIIIKRVSYIIIGLVVITLLIDFFFADDMGFGENRVFIYFEGILFGLFLIFEFLKWDYKKKLKK